MIERLSRVLCVPRLDLQQQQKTSEGKKTSILKYFFAPFEASAGITLLTPADESSATPLGLKYSSSKAKEVAPLLQCLPSMQGSRVRSPAHQKLGIVAYVCKFTILRAAADIQGHPKLLSQFGAALSYMRSCLKKPTSRL